MPFLPVFAGGTTKFQPVHVGDLASLVEIISRNDPAVRSAVDGKIIEAGGPDGKNRFDGTQPGLDTLADLSQFSFSVDILRNDADRAQMQEQIPTHSVPSVRVWDGPRFLYGETSRKPLHAFTGSSKTT